jgi:hypothetical protein
MKIRTQIDSETIVVIAFRCIWDEIQVPCVLYIMLNEHEHHLAVKACKELAKSSLSFIVYKLIKLITHREI